MVSFGYNIAPDMSVLVSAPPRLWHLIPLLSHHIFVLPDGSQTVTPLSIPSLGQPAALCVCSQRAELCISAKALIKRKAAGVTALPALSVPLGQGAGVIKSLVWNWRTGEGWTVPHHKLVLPEAMYHPVQGNVFASPTNLVSKCL